MIKSEIMMSKIMDYTLLTKTQVADRLSAVGMTPKEINILITQEGTIVLNSKTTLNYSDLGLQVAEVVSLVKEILVNLGLIILIMNINYQIVPMLQSQEHLGLIILQRVQVEL